MQSIGTIDYEALAKLFDGMLSHSYVHVGEACDIFECLLACLLYAPLRFRF